MNSSILDASLPGDCYVHMQVNARKGAYGLVRLSCRKEPRSRRVDLSFTYVVFLYGKSALKERVTKKGELLVR